MDDFDGVMQRL